MFILPPELIAAFDEDTVRPINLVMVDWPGGAVFVHTGVGTISFQGEVWYGVAELGGIGNLTSDSNVGSHSVDLSLSGIDPKTLNEIILNDVVNRDVEIYIGAMSEDGNLINASPYFYGRISSVSLQRYGDDAIVVSAVSKTADWAKSQTNRYTDESHLSRHPDDDFFQYVVSMGEREIYWESEKTSVPLTPRGA